MSVAHLLSILSAATVCDLIWLTVLIDCHFKHYRWPFFFQLIDWHLSNPFHLDLFQSIFSEWYNTGTSNELLCKPVVRKLFEYPRTDHIISTSEILR